LIALKREKKSVSDRRRTVSSCSPFLDDFWGVVGGGGVGGFFGGGVWGGFWWGSWGGGGGGVGWGAGGVGLFLGGWLGFENPYILFYVPYDKAGPETSRVLGVASLSTTFSFLNSAPLVPSFRKQPFLLIPFPRPREVFRRSPNSGLFAELTPGSYLSSLILLDFSIQGLPQRDGLPLPSLRDNSAHPTSAPNDVPVCIASVFPYGFVIHAKDEGNAFLLSKLSVPL